MCFCVFVCEGSRGQQSSTELHHWHPCLTCIFPSTLVPDTHTHALSLFLCLYLLHNFGAAAVLPVPDSLKKLFAAKIVAGKPFLLCKPLLNHTLRCNPWCCPSAVAWLKNKQTINHTRSHTHTHTHKGNSLERSKNRGKEAVVKRGLWLCYTYSSTCMVEARHPNSIEAAHSTPSCQCILHRDGECVAEMKCSRHIGGRKYHHKSVILCSSS